MSNDYEFVAIPVRQCLTGFFKLAADNPTAKKKIIKSPTVPAYKPSKQVMNAIHQSENAKRMDIKTDPVTARPKFQVVPRKNFPVEKNVTYQGVPAKKIRNITKASYSAAKSFFNS